MTPRTMFCLSAVISAVCALGCSDPEPQAAAVGLTLKIGSPDMIPPGAQGCSAGAGVTKQIGNPAPEMGESGQTYSDGQHDVAVTCAVKGKSTFSVSAKVSQGKNTSFTISNGTIDKETGTGTFDASIFTGESQSLSSTAMGALGCTFTVPDSGEYIVKSGAIYTKFSCPRLNNDQGVEAYCGATGDLVLEYCEE